MGHHRHAALLVALPGPGHAVIRTHTQHPRAARQAARTLIALPASLAATALLLASSAHAEPTAPTPANPSAAATAKANPEDDGEPRLSLPTTADRAMWRTSGFRLGLGLVYGRLVGLRGAPSGRLIGPTIRIGGLCFCMNRI